MAGGIRFCAMMVANGVLLSTSFVCAAFPHDDWAVVLDRFVSEDGLVDYAALAEDRETLDRYVRAVETTSPQSDPEEFPTRQHELAYYINAYNALVFAGVLERGPEEDSVWKGGLISGYGFFVARKIRVGGDKTNLRKLENAVIRKVYEDPRIHAALNCASMGCPRLPRVPFVPERLDEQLDDAIREFVSDERHVRVDDTHRTVYLSKIFDWFKSDFAEYEKNHGNPEGTVVDYINRYRESSASVPTDYRVKFLDYDKRINKQGQPWTPPSLSRRGVAHEQHDRAGQPARRARTSGTCTRLVQSVARRTRPATPRPWRCVRSPRPLPEMAGSQAEADEGPGR